MWNSHPPPAPEKVQLMEKKSRMVVARGWMGAEMGEVGKKKQISVMR